MTASTSTLIVTSLLVSAALTPFMARLAWRLDLVDRPGPRKDHRQPLPLLGGVAIYAAVIVAVVLWRESRALTGITGMLIGATWVSFLGLWDDRRGLPVSAKLGGQLIAAVVLVVSGIQVQLPLPSALNIGITLLWVVGVTNAFNLIDNMDGLAGGTGALVAVFFLWLALVGDQPLVATLSAAALGACLGFLLYNFNPARIFLGDSGSLFLGYVFAALGIELRFPANVPWVTWMVPILVLGLPIFDTTLVVLSRLRRGRNPFTSPGRDHLSHRLHSLGWTRRQVVLVLYVVSMALGLTAVAVSQAGVLGAYLLAGCVTGAALLALWWLEVGSRRPGSTAAPAEAPRAAPGPAPTLAERPGLEGEP